MKKAEVKVGQVYWAKISGRSVKAKIESFKGNAWEATNLNSGRKATIKSATNLDEIIEGRNVHSDRKLRKQQEQERVKQLRHESQQRDCTSQTKFSMSRAQKKEDINQIAKDALTKSVSSKADRSRLPVSRKITSISPVKKENIKPIRKGTKQQAIAEALVKGATIDDLCQVTGWDRKSAHGQVHGGLSSRKGYGINQKGDKYYLVFPDGLNELIYA